MKNFHRLFLYKSSSFVSFNFFLRSYQMDTVLLFRDLVLMFHFRYFLKDRAFLAR